MSGRAAAGPPAVEWVCAGCGHRAPAAEPWPFRCPRARDGDDVDHALRRALDPGVAAAAFAEAFGSGESSPMVRFRRLLGSHASAAARGLADGAFVELARSLDRRIERVGGAPLRETPLASRPGLARAAGVAELWVKDETGNPGGSHKIRHLDGAMLWIEAMEATGARAAAPLAIASCGNAAVAAAVTARAAGRELRVFAPRSAHERVVAQLGELGAEVELCARRPGERGDPAYLAFHRAVAAGALPFSVQGPDNAVSVEGGYTLGWELAARIAAGEAAPDALVVQVGGGALAASVFGALVEAHDAGAIERLPRLYAVQTRAVAPLARAWDRLAAELLEEAGGTAALGAGAETPAGRAAIARRLAERLPPQAVAKALHAAARRRSRYMWQWEEEGSSVADAILDDETYDWLEVVRGLLATGGIPVTVSEAQLEEAWELAFDRAAGAVGPTGSSGLAGCLELARAGVLAPEARVAVLWTGITRNPERLARRSPS